MGCYRHSRDTGGIFEGAAYVFARSGATWKSATQTVELEPSGLGDFDEYGARVAISGNLIVVGAPGWFMEKYYGQAYGYLEPAHGWGSGGSGLTVPISDDLVPALRAEAGDDELAVSAALPLVTTAAHLGELELTYPAALAAEPVRSRST